MAMNRTNLMFPYSCCNQKNVAPVVPPILSNTQGVYHAIRQSCEKLRCLSRFETPKNILHHGKSSRFFAELQTEKRGALSCTLQKLLMQHSQRGGAKPVPFRKCIFMIILQCSSSSRVAHNVKYPQCHQKDQNIFEAKRPKVLIRTLHCPNHET